MSMSVAGIYIKDLSPELCSIWRALWALRKVERRELRGRSTGGRLVATSRIDMKQTRRYWTNASNQSRRRLNLVVADYVQTDTFQQRSASLMQGIGYEYTRLILVVSLAKSKERAVNFPTQCLRMKVLGTW
jgi:hypothetical protein